MSNLEMQKSLVLNCMSLGMSFNKAVVLSELTAKQVEKLENDIKFMTEVELQLALKEKELLERYHAAIEIASAKGNTKPIETMLAHLNPNDWDNKKDNSNDDKGSSIQKTIVYLPDNGR